MSSGLLEKPWQTQVTNLATHYGWKCSHFHDSRRQVIRRGRPVVIGDKDAAGFPDLVLVRGPELLFVELKTDKGRTTPAQNEWIAALQLVAEAVGHSAACQTAHYLNHGYEQDALPVVEV